MQVFMKPIATDAEGYTVSVGLGTDGDTFVTLTTNTPDPNFAVETRLSPESARSLAETLNAYADVVALNA